MPTAAACCATSAQAQLRAGGDPRESELGRDGAHRGQHARAAGRVDRAGLDPLLSRSATIAAHVVGYVAAVSEEDLTGDDPLLELPDFRIGKSGIEKAYDLELRGTAGTSQVEVNAFGRVVRELAREDGMPGQEHRPRPSTWRCRISRRSAAPREQSAACVLLDAWTGDVLALASTPGFDPGAFAAGLTPGAVAGAGRTIRYKPLSNKAISGTYAPGSTFKPVVALAALEVRRRSRRETRFYLPRLLSSSATPVPLLEEGRPRHAGSARRHQAFLRRVFLRDRRAVRHRPHRGRWRSRFGLGSRARHRHSRRTSGPDSDPAGSMATTGVPLAAGRDAQRRHRPELCPGDAAAARDICGAARHRSRRDAAARCARTASSTPRDGARRRRHRCDFAGARASRQGIWRWCSTA